MRSLVALDLDGTLIGWDGELPRSSYDAVRTLLSSGTHVVLSTGRSMLATTPVAEQLELRRGWMVCSNGAIVATIDPLEITDMVTFDAGPAVRLLREQLPEALVAVEELGVGYRVTAPFPEGELVGRQEVATLDQILGDPVTRVVLRCPAEEPDVFLEIVDKLGLKDVTYIVGHTAWLDLAPKGVSKASALELVRERLGVPRSATFAVGDGRNDIEMLQWAATGVAMGDAPVEVQDAADQVTETFENDGLALALERWLPAVA